MKSPRERRRVNFRRLPRSSTDRSSRTLLESSDRRLFQWTPVSGEREDVALGTHHFVELSDIFESKRFRWEIGTFQLSPHDGRQHVWRESNHERMLRMLENVSEIRDSLHGPADRLPDLIVIYEYYHYWVISRDECLTDVGQGGKEPNRRKVLSPEVEEHLHLWTMTRTNVSASMSAPFACSDIVAL